MPVQPLPQPPSCPCDQKVCTDFPDANILIVDDFAENIALLQNILTGAGYRHIYSVTDPRMAEQHLQHQALHDSLTDLPNRTLFLDRLQQSIYLAERMDRRVAVLLLDLNHFQEVNDTLGHLNGDALLKQVGQRLHDGLRRSDTVARVSPGDHTIARLGGDEFAVVLPGLPAAADAMAVVERIQQVLRLPFEINGVIFEVGATIGMVTFSEHGRDAATLMRRADVAVHAAKRTRQDCLLYAPEHDHFSPLRLGLMADLRQAVTGQGLELHYQPKLDLQKQQLVGFEALVRWQHPTHGSIRPDLFIPLAEETGAIKLLTHWVLGTALVQCAALRAAGIAAGVAINLSARDLLDPSLSERVLALLAEHRVPASALTLEVTESTMMEDPTRALAAISKVAEHGVRFSIDDFGTGYSSLAYLKKLPVKEVKLDRSFITDMARDHKNTMIVRSVIELAHNLELKVVAEGIEDAATGQLLRALGCDEGQGWHIAKPMPAADVETWVRSSSWQPPRSAS